MLLVLPWEAEKGYHAVPVALQRRHGLGVDRPITLPELLPEPLAVCLRRGIGELAEQFPGLGLQPARELAQHVEKLVVPAPLLGAVRIHPRQRTPDAQMAIGEGEFGSGQPAGLQGAQDPSQASVDSRIPLSTARISLRPSRIPR